MAVYRWDIVLIGLLVLGRLIWQTVYAPTEWPDTFLYRQFADHLTSVNFHGFNGARTPGFPLLIALCAKSALWITLCQQLLGTISAWMVFRLTRRFTGSCASGLLAGLLSGLSLNVLLFESGIMTETLASFLMVAAFFLFCRWLDQGPSVGTALWLGGTLAAIGMVRPNLLFVAPVILAVLWVPGRLRAATSWQLWGLLAGPYLACTLGWCGFVYQTTGYFGPTTLTGFNLTQHTGAFVEFASSRYAPLRDIYLVQRKQAIQETGSHSMTIWRCIQAMRDETGQTLPELSRTLTGMSVELIARQPVLYAKSVRHAWLNFWQVPAYLARESVIRKADLPTLLRGIEKNRRLLHAVNGLFLWIVAAASVALVWRPKALLKAHLSLYVAGTIVLMGSVLQAFLEFGENARYFAPFQAVVIMVVITAVWLAGAWLGRQGTAIATRLHRPELRLAGGRGGD